MPKTLATIGASLLLGVLVCLFLGLLFVQNPIEGEVAYMRAVGGSTSVSTVYVNGEQVYQETSDSGTYIVCVDTPKRLGCIEMTVSKEFYEKTHIGDYVRVDLKRGE